MSQSLVLLHGRGGMAGDMRLLAEQIIPTGVSVELITPQAAHNSWYPYSFIAPFEQNQPFLDMALAQIDAAIEQCLANGTASQDIVLGGFSQGACLALEYAARHPRRYGAVLGLSGALIGPPATVFAYSGSLAGTPVILSAHSQDPHIPLWRWQESAELLSHLGAKVTSHLTHGFGHGIEPAVLLKVQALLNTVMIKP
jgi:predicted esterase